MDGTARAHYLEQNTVNLNRKLEAWREAEILDAGTADRIRAFEEKEKRPTALYALVGLGALAIGIGFIAIVAANWDAIPPVAKLGVDLVIAMALAVGIDRLAKHGPRWGAEALITIYYLFVLASIGLIGQIYQLGSPLHVALGVWSLATLPLLFLTRTRFAAVLWAAGLITTYVMNAVEWVSSVTDTSEPDLIVTLAVALPLLLLGLGWALRNVSEKSARTFEEIAWIGIAGGAFGTSFFWYETLHSNEVVSWGAGAVILLVTTTIVLGRRFFGEHVRLASLSLIVAATSFLLPVVMPHGGLKLVGGLVGLAVLGFAAFATYSIGHRLGFSILTATIGIRIITIYFEVFGSLMSTGLGLISGGVLTLIIAWLWTRTSRTLKDNFDPHTRDTRVEVRDAQ